MIRPNVLSSKKIFARKLKEQYAESLLEGELKVDLQIFRASSMFRCLGASSKRYGDIDNLAKGILDACNGVIWQDDSQIVDLHVKKGGC